ncbi:hypothetical protein [Photobacterium damselae]|uniref:hypothetical protein n=1 Tax=Photobacterium damselae TaxID=38293 RepID=UPI0010FEF795|nr:hypothetical protein [Photobacterium damselae]TLS72228.1 hypothetical protein FD718_03020 [Photobacterium damselae subsp. damselae]
MRNTISINIAIPKDHYDFLIKKATNSHRSFRAESTIRLLDFLTTENVNFNDVKNYICHKNNIGTFVTCEIDHIANKKLDFLVNLINKERIKPVPKNLIAGACLALHLQKYDSIFKQI